MELISRKKKKKKSILMKRNSTCKVPEVAASWKEVEVTGAQMEG